jgi:hypothetical protein
MLIARAPRPGGEVDAWCTKCRMDLLHRIIAMQNGRIVRVECRTCGGHHNYRKPKDAPAEAKSAASPRHGSNGTAQTRSSPPGSRKSAAAQAELDRAANWEKAVLGQPIAKFRAYRANETFQLGDLIRHGKFGDGFIVRVIDRQKVEVMFKDGSRTLAQALQV